MNTLTRADIIVGWTETWTSTPEDGFVRTDNVPLVLPRLKVQRIGKRRRVVERKSLGLARILAKRRLAA